jgi:hypothetical protein
VTSGSLDTGRPGDDPRDYGYVPDAARDGVESVTVGRPD